MTKTGNRKRFWSRSGRRRSTPDYRRMIYLGVFFLVLAASGWGLYQAVVYAHGTAILEIRNVQVRGERRVTESEVLARVGHVPGSNVLAVQLDEIRESVEELGWVRYATVHRIWPNELAIVVMEREAVALARIDGMIVQADRDGIVLPPDPLVDTELPILDGLRRPASPGDTRANAGKVRAYLQIVEELDGALSEVHVSDGGDVSVVPNDDPVVVNLGSEEHAARWARYEALRERIREDFPEATRIDLRFRDQVIIHVDDGVPAEKIIWGDETKLL